MGESRSVASWLREIRAGWPALVASIVGCLILALVVTSSQPELYGARGNVVVSPERFLQSEGTDALPALTENVVRLSSTEAVLIPAARRFAEGGQDVAERQRRRQVATLDWLRDHIRVEKVGTSSVVEVTGKAPTSDAAIDLTRGTVESLTQFVRETRGDEPSPTGESAPPSGLIILSSAESTGQVSPTPIRNAFVALNVGALLGLLLALAVGRRRMRGDPHHVASELGVPLLALNGGGSNDEEAITAARRLLGSLQERRKGSLVVLLTGPTAGGNIAQAATRLGAALCLSTSKRTLLVDVDIEGHTLTSQLRLGGQRGLTDLIDGRIGTEDLMPSIVPLYEPSNGDGAMAVLPAGTAEGSGPIESSQLAAILKPLAEEFDYFLLTGPSVAKTVDLLALIGAAHYCLMITDGRISPQRLEAARVLRQDARPGAMGLISMRGPRRWLPQRS